MVGRRFPLDGWLSLFLTERTIKMKKEIFGILIGISTLSVNAASFDYLNEFYSGTVYESAKLHQITLSEDEIAAENESNGYFQEWDQEVLSRNEENGYWQ